MDLDAPAVLVVEDEALVRMDVLDALGDVGLPCFEAGDAEEALKELEDHPSIALLFTDINMPGTMDGLALAERVHQERPGVEIIVTSGGQQLHEDDLPDHGLFLAKPYQPKRLVALVREKLLRWRSVGDTVPGGTS
jgi:CheY-like chemotaxis protein